MASIDENVEAFFVFFISGLDVRRIISHYDELLVLFFLYHLLVCGQRFDHSPLVFLLKCWRVAVGRDYFLFQTVIIMQLVFECSGYKCLPLQACVPGFLYSIIVFTSSFYWCLPSNKWLSVCSSLVRILRIYFFEADSRLVVKVTDNTENKTVLLWCYSHVISRDGCFLFFFANM